MPVNLKSGWGGVEQRLKESFVLLAADFGRHQTFQLGYLGERSMCRNFNNGRALLLGVVIAFLAISGTTFAQGGCMGGGGNGGGTTGGTTGGGTGSGSGTGTSGGSGNVASAAAMMQMMMVMQQMQQQQQLEQLRLQQSQLLEAQHRQAQQADATQLALKASRGADLSTATPAQANAANRPAMAAKRGPIQNVVAVKPKGDTAKSAPSKTDLETRASNKFHLAEQALSKNRSELAKKLLEELLADYPETTSAVKAKELLSTL